MKVTFKTNLNQFRGDLRKEIKKMDQANKRGVRDVANFMSANARLLAPKRSGKLINSIRHFPIENGRRVIADAVGRNNFPYPLWINQNTGFKTLNYPKGGPFGLKRGDKAVYGSLPSGWRWTGKPKFWDRAVIKTKSKFKDIILKQYKNMVVIR